MSFVRAGRQQHTKGKKPARAKKAAASKREWVSTVNDLTIHKLTPAELSHRHEMHQSHNKAAAQWELREKALQRRFRNHGSPAPLDQASLCIIREVFSDQLLLQDVLARSDRAMAVVKDLFGDAPRRQTGHPSVTMAPNCDSDCALPVLQRPDPPTQLSLLSQSMMDQQALNEVEASEDDYSDEDTSPTCRVIQSANLRKMRVPSRCRLMQQQNRPNSDQPERDDCASGRAPDRAALNATVCVQHVRSRQSKSEEGKEEQSALVSQILNPELPLNQSGRSKSCTHRTGKCVSQGSELNRSTFGSLSGDQSSLGLLEAMLGQVEADLDTLSPGTEPASAQSHKQHRKQGLTGFSVALISTLGRLVHLLKQREQEAHNEAEERRRLEGEVREQRGLIDALTAETLTLREEAAALQVGLQQQTAELEQKLDTMVLLMGGLGLLETDAQPNQDTGVKAAVCQSAPVAERDPERLRASVSPAVSLSPPRQRNDSHSPVTHPIETHHPVDIIHSYKGVQAHSSTSSLTSLPLTSLPSTSSLSPASGPLSSQLSPEAILAEIAQLSRQNDLIKAQLSQAKGLGPGAVESQSRLSPCSLGRVMPRNAEERRSSVSSTSTERSRHDPAAEGERVTNQVASPHTLSVRSMEERLLELNRQTTAARGRLLELIEQQKQSVSARVSPSDSDSPPSACSPQPAGGGGGPEVSMPLPDHDVPSLTGVGEKRDAASEGSSHSAGGVTRDDKTQVHALTNRLKPPSGSNAIWRNGEGPERGGLPCPLT